MSAFERVLDARICAVVAPAGAGKTTALAQWAQQTPVDVAWFQVGPDSVDPGLALLEGLAAAAHSADPQHPRAFDWDALVEVCVRRDSPLVVVVDDFHHLTSDRCRSLLERLLLATDDRLHLVVSSRMPPAVNMARTELASELVGPSDLRFRTVEMPDLFRDCYDLPSATPTLGSSPGGRADGPRPSTCSTTPSPAAVPTRATARCACSGVARLRTRVPRPDLPGRARRRRARFLRQTATLETLTGDHCDSLLGSSDSQERLIDLSRRGVLVPAEAGRGFRTPEVLRTHLLAAMREDLGDELTDDRLRATAALLALEDGANAAAAVRTYAAGRDWPAALAVFAEPWDR